MDEDDALKNNSHASLQGSYVVGTRFPTTRTEIASIEIYYFNHNLGYLKSTS